MRRIAVLFVPLLMAGCAALPPQLALVTQAADGVSYVFTGKSSTDHIVSAAFSRDCAVIRVVQGEPICKARLEDTEEGQAAIQMQGGQPGAALGSPAAGDQMVALYSEPAGPGAAAAERAQGAAASVAPVPLLPDPGKLARGSGGQRADPVPAARAEGGGGAGPPRGKSAYYVVVGDYRDWGRALDRAGRQEEGVATIVTARQKGAKTHRVMIGPYGLAAARDARRSLPRLGTQAAWLARACPHGAGPRAETGCMDLEKTWR